MKTVTAANNPGNDNSPVENVESFKFEEGEQAEMYGHGKHWRLTAFRVGTRVERELDGLWFPGTITGVVPESDCYEIEYDEDMNREREIPRCELRLLDPNRTREQPVAKELTAHQREMLRKDSLLLQTADYDPNKAPTVVLHRQGETNAAGGYIINGLENNVATGNGLRGIRWLRGNSF
ncbi:hypothetical protein GN244_ATG18542 [Phytophthora infestans]|uniref:Tudor domain-containing protein n=1 Tax=Phytophthora infestans TaxID=4787 RepID=A0A833W4Q4_PHYIN|nr:hypothetical protein GN244_ATG18542 [Phytophthora infestans]KAF4136162.1 hypothetical protein GN958_ATG14644 [Phytophthora infestans]KAI9984175.1 hypothetical protein PInf_005468 [Phytophthora infestans]